MVSITISYTAFSRKRPKPNILPPLGTDFIYGTERPFDNSYCHGPFTCTIMDTQTTTVTYNIGISPEKLKALGLGVTGGFSYATATARARSYSLQLKEGNCRYFTFVPVQKDVWYFSPMPSY